MDTTDEKYPLLLLGNDDGGRKMEFKKKTRFSDVNRNKNILQGATTIITQWPGRCTYFLEIFYHSKKGVSQNGRIQGGIK